MIPAPLTVTDAAAQLGISRASLYRLVRAGAIPVLAFPIGGLRIEPDALEAFKARCRRGAVVSLPTRPSKATRQQVREATDITAARARRLALAQIGRGR